LRPSCSGSASGSRPVGTNILDELQPKAQALLQHGRWPRVHYALFARSAFTPTLEARARDEGVKLITLEAICR